MIYLIVAMNEITDSALAFVLETIWPPPWHKMAVIELETAPIHNKAVAAVGITQGCNREAYRQTSGIRCTKYMSLDDSRLILQQSIEGVKSRMKM